MEIKLPRPLEDDIMNFCYMNNIKGKDINTMFVNFIKDGFTVLKYGNSPIDNFNSENKPVKIDNNEIAEKDNNLSLDDNKNIIKPKKTIKIIKK